MAKLSKYPRKIGEDIVLHRAPKWQRSPKIVTHPYPRTPSASQESAFPHALAFSFPKQPATSRRPPPPPLRRAQHQVPTPVASVSAGASECRTETATAREGLGGDGDGGEGGGALHGGEGPPLWLNKIAYGWILFRFVGSALGLYQLDSAPLSPSDVQRLVQNQVRVFLELPFCTRYSVILSTLSSKMSPFSQICHNK